MDRTPGDCRKAMTALDTEPTADPVLLPFAPPPAEFRVLDLFSGIGGFSLGLERAGFRTVAFCEIEGYACRVLRQHWAAVPIFEDVRTLTRKKLKSHGLDPNVICGGFPCQDLSTAGKGAGLDGKRSGLWSEYCRLIREVRPLYAIVENVAALRSRGLDRVLGDLAAIGYDATWRSFPASALGAPHRRDRLWLVAYPHRDGRPFELRLEAQSPAHLAESWDARAATHWPRVRSEWPREGDDPGQAESLVCRVSDGFPHLVDRLAGLGNAVCPPVVELIGRAIVRHHLGDIADAAAA